MATEADNFFSRWSRRKLQTQEQPPAPLVPRPHPPEAPKPAAASAAPAGDGLASLAPLPPAAPLAPAAAAEPPPSAATQPPTLADLALLDHDSSYARFVANDVSPDVRNAAMKKLFTDPHYNVMDGLDVYIDDYGQPDPLPARMLRQMVQSKMLGLFAAEDAADEAAAAAARNGLARGSGGNGNGNANANANANDNDNDNGNDNDHEPAPAAGRATAESQEPRAGAAVDPALLALQPSHPGIDDTARAPHPAADAVTLATAPDEDTHLQLQPVDDAGCAGAHKGAGQDAGCQRGRTR